MSIAPGTRLGPYEIVAPIGAGGMGEVFRARDTRLHRDVALKLLPAAFAHDETRRARLTQEARAAGALNHPGIVAVYDIGLEGDAFYIVTELVDGDTLRTMLAEGSLPQRKTIDIAVQVAEALAAAHAAGITHRDLKPENIMVTRDGRAKVLDFGLAKQTARTASAETETVALTQEGTVMGTIGYMAPEQVRGKTVDARSDIFSFGVVLHEMLSGASAFHRDTSADTLSAILKEDPAELPGSVPAGLARIVQRCVEKEPAQRFQSAADLAFALRSPVSGAMPVSTTAPTRNARRAWIPYAIAVIGVLAGAVGWLYRPEATAVPYDITPLTAFTGVETMPALSPDGKQIAFAWAGQPPAALGVYVSLIGGGTQPLRISPPDKVAVYPSWSPDARRVAYLRTEGGETVIAEAPALGGPERRIAHFPGPGSSLAWSPDGKSIVAYVREAGGGSLQLISTESGERQRLTTSPASGRDGNPRFSPDGRYLAFIRFTSLFDSSIYKMRVNRDGTAAGTAEPIGNRTWYTYSLDWFPDGRSLVLPVIEGAACRYWKLWLDGTATRLPLEFQRDGTTTAESQVSLRGSRLATILAASQTDIGRLEWNAADKRWQPAVFYNSSREDVEPQIAPNGQWMVFTSTRSGAREIWRAAPDGSGALQLTSSAGLRPGSPRWSADSQWIAYDMPKEGNYQIWVVSAEGGKTRQLTTARINHVRPSFSHDGKWVYFGASTGGPSNVLKMPFQGGEEQPITKGGGADPFESMDGRWVYYQKAGADSIFRVPVEGGEERLVGQAPGAITWALAPDAIYFGPRGPSRIVRFDLASGKKETIYQFPPEAIRYGGGTSLAVSADGRTIYHHGSKHQDTDIVMVDNFR